MFLWLIDTCLSCVWFYQIQIRKYLKTKCNQNDPSLQTAIYWFLDTCETATGGFWPDPIQYLPDACLWLSSSCFAWHLYRVVYHFAISSWLASIYPSPIENVRKTINLSQIDQSQLQCDWKRMSNPATIHWIGNQIFRTCFFAILTGSAQSFDNLRKMGQSDCNPQSTLT